MQQLTKQARADSNTIWHTRTSPCKYCVKLRRRRSSRPSRHCSSEEKTPRPGAMLCAHCATCAWASAPQSARHHAQKPHPQRWQVRAQQPLKSKKAALQVCCKKQVQREAQEAAGKDGGRPYLQRGQASVSSSCTRWTPACTCEEGMDTDQALVQNGERANNTNLALFLVHLLQPG